MDGALESSVEFVELDVPQSLSEESDSDFEVADEPFLNRAAESAREMMYDFSSLAGFYIPQLEENLGFIANPDDPKEHFPDWHQFGVLGHTRKFLVDMTGETVACLRKWGIEKDVARYFSEEINGRSKWELMQITAVFHDLGKFAGRYWDGEKFVFNGHEALSERLIKEEDSIRAIMGRHGLGGEHIEYIARCTGLHYDLGNVRDGAWKTRGVYDMEYAVSGECEELMKGIAVANEDFAMEIGVLFLADSLAKTDVRMRGRTDEQVAAELGWRGLNPKLLNAAKQIEVNMEVGKRYLGFLL